MRGISQYNMPGIRAVIFDLDGTLIDSERITLKAYLEAGGELGYPVTEEIMLGLIGLDSRSSEQRLIEHLGPSFSYKALRARAHEIRSRMGLELKAGAADMLQFVKDSGLRCGLATSTRIAYVEVILDALDLRKYFDTYVGGDQVARGKPAPEIYLRAASQLGIAPEDCVAFEDSEPGLRSAIAAGMCVIHVPDLRVLPLEVQGLAFAVEPSLVSAKVVLKKLLTKD